MIMESCESYNPDHIFEKFKVVEFPTLFVGLPASQRIDVGIDLNRSAYIKTLCEGRLQKFEEAHEVSAHHRAFKIVQIDDHTLEITFHPKNECITKAKRQNKENGDRFIIDLRLINVNEIRCCGNELHAEVGRFYLCGQYDHCQITNHPKVIDFGQTFLNKATTRYVRIRNESNLVAANFFYEKLGPFRVSPAAFTLRPNTSIKLTISIKPPALKVATTILFKIKNIPDKRLNFTEDDEWAILYTIETKINISYYKTAKEVVIESMHTLYDQLPKYAYLDKELEIHKQRQKTASEYLHLCNCIPSCKCPKQNVERKILNDKNMCYSDITLNVNKPNPNDFCKKVIQKITIYDLFDVEIQPHLIDFGRVSLSTFGKDKFTIWNKSKYSISIQLQYDECVVYTDDMIKTTSMKVKPMSKCTVAIACLGFIEGNYKGTFCYLIDNKFLRKHPYTLCVGNSTLMIIDSFLKFGMVTPESFISSVPIRIYNHFNVPTKFVWSDLHSEIPFLISPMSGNVPSHGCKLCEITYLSKPSKTKLYEVELNCLGAHTKCLEIELNIVTRKLSVKFLQVSVVFKDIPLNIKVIEKIRLENSSKEQAVFHVLEPLIPGFTVVPMSGTIGPKTIVTFDLIVKIACLLEFAFDIQVKINNKEILTVPVTGAVVDPKINIQPKNIYMSRVPCNLVTYVPIVFYNLSTVAAEVEVLDTAAVNMCQKLFDVYIACGNEKQIVSKFSVLSGQPKTVYIKVYDVYRREYEMFIPFRINDLLGPPHESNVKSTELQYYVGEYEQLYENNTKVKLKSMHKDICYCRITGVITVPWLLFSVDTFEFDYNPNGKNTVLFTIKNISQYYLYVTILTSKLAPNFTLDLCTVHHQSIINEAVMKFELEQQQEAGFRVIFHPKGQGKFVATAILFLDKNMTIPYYNFTFNGKRMTPAMTPSCYRVTFPACNIGETLTEFITIEYEKYSEFESFRIAVKDESNLTVKYTNYEVKEDNNRQYIKLFVKLQCCSKVSFAGKETVNFFHEDGSACVIMVYYCVTFCPLTLHANKFVKLSETPYPYYPLPEQTDLYDYMEKCCEFLEKWMYQQGFRRDLYPTIPDTLLAISPALSSQQGSVKRGKGINVSYLNFVKRIAGPLMKHVRKVTLQAVDESFKYVKEIHDTYKAIICLLQARGANIWALEAKYLLNYDQFIIYTNNVPAKRNSDVELTKQLTSNEVLFNRLSKQSWIDFILQSYKVLIMDSCFFECVCVSSIPRDIIKILIDWYNQQILSQQRNLLKDKPVKLIENITTDLSNGIAIASALINYCPFLREHFTGFCEISEKDKESDIVNNACLIIDGINQLKLYFPLCSQDFYNPHFLQMLFLSIHLYVVLPMFIPKDTITLSPPLQRTASCQVAICPTGQESLTFTHTIINNTKNSFLAEKFATDGGKKISLMVKYSANFVEDEDCLLLVHGYNKTRIFDTYIVFVLLGKVSALYPIKKCKVIGPLYRPNRVDVMVVSPFFSDAEFQIHLTDIEPTIPVIFEDQSQSRFYVRRLNLIDTEITLNGMPKDAGQDQVSQKLYLQLVCLSAQTCNSFIWFRSKIGDFFIKVVTHPRWDIAVDTFNAYFHTWPVDPCSCGEACECYRTSVVTIPYRNELTLKALRFALAENASDVMLNVFDLLVESENGKIILSMLLEEGGTNMSEVRHILRSETTYKVKSRTLNPRLKHVTLAQHTDQFLTLPLTVPVRSDNDKYSLTFISNCGMDIRTYKIVFMGSPKE